MKKMKRFLVAMLSCLTAIACVAGVSACKKETANNDSNDTNSSVVDPSYDININWPTEETPAPCVHDYSVEYAVTKVATCEGTGEKIVGCSKCGDKMTITVNALGHNFGDAKCGDGVVACMNGCVDQSGNVTTKDFKAHDFADATCTAPKTCKVCKVTEGEKLAHTEVTKTEKCVTTKSCSVCKEVFETKAAHTMAYALTAVPNAGIGAWAVDNYQITTTVVENETVVAATCTVDGLKDFKICTVCADAFVTEYVKDLDNAAAWSKMSKLDQVNLIASNVYTEDYEEAKIPAAHKLVNYFKADAKDTTAVVNTLTANEKGEFIPADCTKKGLKNFQVCSVCNVPSAGYSTDFDVIADMVTLDADENAETEKILYTEGYAEAVTVALGHDYVNPTTNKTTYKAGYAATCKAPGKTASYTCYRSGCGVSQVETEIAKLPHDGAVYNTDTTLAANVTFKNANSKVAACGNKNYCGICGEYWGVEGAHTPKTLAAVSKTCTTDGYFATSWACEKCDYVKYDYDYATGHNFDGAVEVPESAANCATNGLKAHYLCTNNCGTMAIGNKNATTGVVESYTVVTEAQIIKENKTGHKFVLTAGAAATPLNGQTLLSQLVNAIRGHAAAQTTNTCDTYAQIVANSYICSVCNYVPAVAHDNSAPGTWYLDVNGYPVSKAQAAYIANGVVYENFAAVPANLVNVAIPSTYNVGATAATCTANAKCNLCNTELAATAKGHAFIMLETDARYSQYHFDAVEASCVTAGRQAYYACSNNCGAVSTDGMNVKTAKDANGNTVNVTTGNVYTYLAIKALGHAMVDVAYKLPTCTENGYYAHKACADCGLKQNYVEIQKPYSHASYATGSCSEYVVCDCAYYASWTDTNNNGVIDQGEYTLTGCGETFRNPNYQPDNHSWLNGVCQACTKVCEHDYQNDEDHDTLKECTICKKEETPVAP